MKVKGFVAAVALTAVFIAPAPAQAQENELSFFAGVGGASASFEGLENTWQGGLGLLGGARMPLLSIASLRADGELNFFPMDADGFRQDLRPPTGTYSGGTLTTFLLAAGLEAHLPAGMLPAIDPYVRGGVGFMSFNTSTIRRDEGGEIPPMEMDDMLSYSIGAGLRVGIGPAKSVFVDVGQSTTLGGDSYGAFRLGLGL